MNHKRLKILGKNKTELTAINIGKVILFSYGVPVACYDIYNGKEYKTDKFFSKTTQKHISQWIPNAETKPQSYFDNLL